MYQYPAPIKELINHFAKLPGIGPKMAERLVLYLLKNNVARLTQMGNSMLGVRSKISICAVCGNFVEKNFCPLCLDPKKDKTKICVVAGPQDIIALEKTNEYNGLYHVLGGLLSPVDGIVPDKLKIKELEKRLADNNTKTVEVIIALDPTVEGESTSMYLTKILKQYRNIKITKLARGLPMGGDLEYADEVTLKSALQGRITL